MKLERKFDCYENTITPKRKLEGKRKWALYFTIKIAQQQWRGNVKENQISTLLLKKNTTTKKKKEVMKREKWNEYFYCYETPQQQRGKMIGENEMSKIVNPKTKSKRERERGREKERERNGMKFSSKGKVKSLFSH